jgi:PIN domain nuclease of toxin-antitoxin system
VILLLDANALLPALNDPGSLEASVRASIADPGNDVVVSAATVWELEIKASKGKLRLPGDLLAALEAMRADVVPVLGEDARDVARLPPHHADPFDRMLVAQARRLGAVVVSADTSLDAYGVRRLWAS